MINTFIEAADLKAGDVITNHGKTHKVCLRVEKPPIGGKRRVWHPGGVIEYLYDDVVPVKLPRPS